MGKKKKHGARAAYPPVRQARQDGNNPGKPKKTGNPEFDVRIRISKRKENDHFTGDIQAKSTVYLIEAIAVLIQRAAALIGAPVDRVFSTVATVLFPETGTAEEE